MRPHTDNPSKIRTDSEGLPPKIATDTKGVIRFWLIPTNRFTAGLAAEKSN
jgi:hypothetical protein